MLQSIIARAKPLHTIRRGIGMSRNHLDIQIYDLPANLTDRFTQQQLNLPI
jgi:hypothetical protein